MKHTTFIHLCYDHKSFSTAKDAFVEVPAEDGQLLDELAEEAKRKLCKTIHMPVEEVRIHDYRVYHELPMIIKEGAETEPIIRAHWIIEKWRSGYIKGCTCSNCGNAPRDSYNPPKYCDACGAKMDLED